VSTYYSEHILVIKIRALGDTLLATPALRALRRAFPEAGITLVVSPAGEAVVKDNPDVDRILVYSQKDVLYSLKFMARLRQSGYDLVVALHASFRTALMAWATGAAQRVVHNHSGQNYFSTIPIWAKKESKSTIQRDLDAVRALGIPDAGEDLVFPLQPDDYLCVHSFLEENNVGRNQPFWILVPGAGKARKRWTAEAAISFLNQFSTCRKGSWIILAGPADQELANAIHLGAKSHPPVFSQEIKEAGALMSMSQGVVTTDSGPKHVAVAVGARTLTLWTDEPEAEWHPYNLKRHGLVRSRTGVVADIPPDEVVTAAIKHFPDAPLTKMSQ